MPDTETSHVASIPISEHSRLLLATHKAMRADSRRLIKAVRDTAVTEVGPGMSYRFAGARTSGVVRGRRHVVSAGTPDAAVFTYDVELEPQAIPRLARPVLRWWLQHSLRRDVRRLRTLITRAA